MNAGQICMSTERIFVPRSRYESLCCALRSAWASVSNKSPRALYNKASGDRVRALIQGALRQGAEAIIEQTPEIIDDAFVCPTILGQGTTDMALYREESFGPVALVIAVPDEQCSEAEVVDKMVALANDTEYGLSAAVWSSDNSKARAVAKRLEAGAVHINGPVSEGPLSRMECSPFCHADLSRLAKNPTWGLEVIRMGKIQWGGGDPSVHTGELQHRDTI
jgi:aldehyde dehydrogenase (NAD+)